MEYFSIFDTNSTPKEEIKRRHVLLLVSAVILSWIVWGSVNMYNYRTMHGSQLIREVLVDMIETLVEIVVLAELSLIYCKLVIRVFWNHAHSIYRLFAQVIILTILNVLSTLLFCVLYQVVYPNENLFFRVFISDFAVISVLSTTYFVSFIISRHHREEMIALRAKLDNLALQTNNHFVFNCFGTLGGMIRTSPDDAERFLQNFSQIYRYLMRNSNKHLVSLKEEIQFTENFITLIKYRYEGISVDIDESLRRVNAYVPPVSVQQLVENAVKHNGHGPKVSLRVSIIKQADTIVVENNIVPRRDSYQNKSEIGLENLHKRVSLVSGKEIAVQNDGTIFRVQIPLIYEEDLRYESLDY